MSVNFNVLQDELVKVIAEVLEKPHEAITDEMQFVDLDADSMRMLELLIAIEKKFKIDIPETLLPKMINLKETMEIIKSLPEKK